MTQAPEGPKKASEIAAERRRARQEEMLRENLKRRKDQSRARRSPAAATEAGEAPDALDPAERGPDASD
ncbi:hypothetical protein [Aureimonas glaciei]|uniref:Uncharacterized protein n=1 Tax=Aureimonas glaciei TaxID=1776957 RepID=A0A916XUC8_9HYPH|nr:hypothetical protein [Aureimonas glaciei]GGD11267.1 hypothetical protein GCM10011335_12850 [Aureimonas glaciei]